MAEKLLMIALSPTMTEGTITKWKKAEGESFTSGDLLCEVETDKASMDYEAPRKAVLLKIVVPQGGKASVGDTIAVIGKEGEDPGTFDVKPSQEKAAPADLAAKPSVLPQALQPVLSQTRPQAPAGFPRSSPLARKLALELDIDLRMVKGSGPEGRVTEKDIRQFSASEEKESSRHESASVDGVRPTARPKPTLDPIGGKRAVIARRLGESMFSAPHFYLKKRVNAELLAETRARINKSRQKPISFNAILLKLSAMALARHPEINVYWRGDALEKRSVVDVGLAVALPDGLITPIIRDCDSKGIERIDEELSLLVDKAKSKGLAPEEYEGAGFTITNLGSFGIDEFTAIINPPASAILAVGALRKRAVVGEDDVIRVGKTMDLTLGCDHRSIDGAVGAGFLADLATLLEDPFRALL
jgi:pyruvate dehydrogenase E2 component (dihydrolipoamide acetyltransferase)